MSSNTTSGATLEGLETQQAHQDSDRGRAVVRHEPSHGNVHNRTAPRRARCGRSGFRRAASSGPVTVK